MLDLIVGRAAVLVVAAAAPVLQYLDCGSVKVQDGYEGPVYELLGPERPVQGVTAEYRIVDATLGKGKDAPCPENVVFVFDHGTKVPLTNPPTHRLADGTCAVTASASHAFAAAGSRQVEVDVSADVVLNGKAARVVSVAAAPEAGGAPAPAAGAPAPGGFAFGTAARTDSPSHPVGLVAGALAPGGATGVAVIEDAASGNDRLAVHPISAGALGSATRYALGDGADPTAIAIGQLGGDARPDLIVATRNGGVKQFQQVDGGFASLGAPILSGGESVALGDLDADGDEDAAVALGGAAIAVYANIGDGSGLDPNPTIIPLPIAQNATTVAITDADGDGKTDVAYAYYGPGATDPGGAGVARGDNSFNFTPVDAFSAAGLTPFGLAVGDVRGSAAADLVLPRHTTDQVSVLRNDSTPGALAFSETTLPADGAAKSPLKTTVGDVDQDGRLDVIAANYQTDNVSVYRNPGADGTFAAPLLVGAAKGPQQTVILDVNGDGRPDLVTANQGDTHTNVPGSVTVSLQTGGTASRSVRVAGVAPDVDAAYAAAKKKSKRKPKAKTIKAGGGAAINVLSFGKTSYAPDGTGRMRGALVTGTLRATLSKADRKKLGTAATAILNARFAGTLDIDRKIDPANDNPLIARGVLAARSSKAVGKGKRKAKLQACLRLSPGKNGLQKFELIGGTGALAKLRLTGQARPFSIDRPDNPKDKIVITVANGKRRALASTCRRALAKVPK